MEEMVGIFNVRFDVVVASYSLKLKICFQYNNHNLKSLVFLAHHVIVCEFQVVNKILQIQDLQLINNQECPSTVPLPLLFLPAEVFTLYYNILYDSILLLQIDLSFYVMIIYLVLFLIFSFYFHFYFPISFTYTLQILFDLVLHLLLYLVFVLLYLLSFVLSFIPCYLLSQKCQVETNSFILFFLLIYMKTRFNFVFCFLKKGTFFKYYLIAVLICYMYFIIYRGEHGVYINAYENFSQVSNLN